MSGSLVDERYRVLSRIARGGMSTVYLAEDIRLERHVALKVLYPHLADDDSFVDRFEREAKSAARLSHPHVVGVLDQGVDGELAYLVMEYVPGQTLRDLLDQHEKLTPRAAFAVLDPVIEGLSSAHTAGIIHRDVKPENVLISDDGRIKIADFGLSRAISRHTGTGQLFGTVAYLSPELVSGQPADARSDIYAIGVMLYEMLTGTQPFTGEDAIQVAFAHVHQHVPPPSHLLPGLAEDIDELVQWCTARDAEERPVDGAALLGELRHIEVTLSGEQLDYVHPDEPATGKEIQPHAAARRTTDNATEALFRTGDLTTKFARPSNATTVIAPSSNRTQALSVRELSGHNDGGVDNLSPRQQRRTAKDRNRTKARTARTPQKQLNAGNKRRNAIWIAVVILLTLAVAVGGWYFGAGPGALTTVPNVTNQPVNAAQDRIADAGLESSTEAVFHDQLDQGKIVSTEPGADTKIRKFRSVTLFVSKGPQLFAVPNVIQREADSARVDIEESALSVGDITEVYSETVARGNVIAQKPKADEQVRATVKIGLTVSKGREPIQVPVVVGLPESKARQALDAARLQPVIASDAVHDPEVPAGAVVNQTPSDGTLHRDEPVTLTLSLGPELVDVPNVFFQREDAAVRKLKDAGFDVEVKYTYGKSVLGLVAGQDKTGTEPKGSTVTLTVS
nr:Stk1 family PASTA domain-containing Ser/Thr kinase [Arthrobacter roseus]